MSGFDATKLKENLPILLIILIQFASTAVGQVPSVPMLYKQVIAFLLPMVSIVLILVVDYAYTVAASRYLYIEATVRPSGKKLHLFIQEPQEGLHSHPIGNDPNWQHTTLELATRAVLEPHYKDIRKVTVEHDLRWEDRMIFAPAKALYKGYRVAHNKCASITLWEPERNPNTQFHLEDIPRFTLAEAPRDWYYEEHPPNPVDAYDARQKAIAEQGTVSCVDCNFKKDAQTYKEWYMDLQQSYIRLEGIVQTLKNQFTGALSRTRDVTKLMTEQILTLLAAHTKLTEAKKELSPKWFTLTKTMALLAAFVVGIAALTLSPDFRIWVNQNPLIVVVGMTVFAIFGYLMLKKKGA